MEQNKSTFSPNLHWDSLLLLASKIEYKLSKKDADFVEIPSEELKYSVREYAKYIKFLLEIDAIEKKNYSTTIGKCNAFRVKYEIFGHEFDKIKEIKIALKPKFYSTATNCDHLTKWFNSHLQIDYYNYFYSTFSIVEPQNSQKNYEKAVLKAMSYRMSLVDLSNYYFRASRDISSDNRLHTNLTNFPSKLRQFITYDGWDLVSFDVKNSQPYFMIVFLERFEEERIRKIFRRIYRSKIGIMSDRINQILYCKEFQEEYIRLKDLILNGKLYEFLVEIMDFKTKNGKFLVKAYEKETDKNFFNFFDSKRDACKQAFMQILYSPNNRKSSHYKRFESEFPKFCELLHLLKTSTNRKDSYKKFPKLLQQIESDCILDFVTKNIAKEYPNIPMFTIHDSIATIEAYSDVLYKKMNQYFAQYSGDVLPQLKEEYWGLNYIKIKEAV
ncbi:hypothetical protein [Algoriella xinjiangensis]|uniref:hypothetical protein n=1 Tax=Algoriella xinjiangensis TaxID=684065 RepID=UPI000F644E90|nr:hypothetical protein [Algoriella xinjiangensis]